MAEQKIISWEAPEFKDYQKSVGWYIVLLSLAILGIAFFIIVESDLFAAVSIGILAILTFIFSFHKPKIISINLSDRGVHFGNLFYPYKQIKYFWVVHNPNHQTLNFHTTALVNSVVIIELAEQNPDEIRNFLLPYVPEHESVSETVIQKIMHLLNF